MVKPLTFKGDKPSKKRKRTQTPSNDTPPSSLAKVSPPPNASAAAPVEDDTTWVSAEATSDISGPVVLITPTEDPTCLACDANGKVFAHPVENIVENNPSTAEPHDVRQVWVANRVAGTEQFSFKGHHGLYLGCDKFGMMAATREAVGPEEGWSVVPVPGNSGTFALQNVREKFVTVEDEDSGVTIRGDAEGIGFKETVRVRMQARFKPRLKRDKEERARERISRGELEDAVGRRLEDGEVKVLKKARKEGAYHEALLDIKVKGSHDKFA